MAIVNCKECGKEVSDKADKCPHCGVSNPSGSAITGCADVLHGIGCIIMLLPILIVLIVIIIAAIGNLLR